MKIRMTLAALITIIALWGCTRSATDPQPWHTPESESIAIAAQVTPTRTPFLPATRVPGAPILSPTPDAPRTIPTPRSEAEQYVVQPGDTLGQIAQRYSVGLPALVQANDVADPNHLEVGQVLNIPAPDPESKGPDFKIIPDSELVNGPASAYFDLEKFIQKRQGFLVAYQETVDDIPMSGSAIVARVAQEYSVNPRLLLAVLDYRSGWVSNGNISTNNRDYPMGVYDNWRAGLYHQLAWAADNLNRGYYLWKANALTNWVLADGSVIPIDPTINAGTAGVQYLFSLLLGQTDWNQAVSQDGFFATYNSLFGYSFDFAIEPLIPANLSQPTLQLPFKPGDVWSFTGGPHGGWGEGSAWAAIDFAPPGEALGCTPSDAWVVAMTDGWILRAGLGAVIEDLDDDQIEQTGWSILYMHIATNGRVQPGTYVHAGDPIGHPSCEGGVSNGTHVHVARRYNGEWISADGSLPFILDGWTSSGDGIEYDGYLVKNGQTLEAWDGRVPENQIQR